MTDDNPLNETVDTAAEAVTLSINPKRMVAMKTARAYIKSMLAATAKLVPAVAILTGGPSAISQQQELVRKPDEHVPSQSQQAPTAEPMRSLMVAATSASSTFLTGEEFAASQGEVRYVVHVVHADESPSPPPPLPNLKSTEDDNLS
jgi:hypothetical protein